MRRRHIMTLSAVTLVSAAAWVWAAAASPGSLEGRWRLVEQTYGSGRANMAEDGPSLRLEFFRQGERLVARAWLGDGDRGMFGWPSLLEAEGAEIHDAEIVFAPGEDRVRATYRTTPPPGESIGLEIVEAYRVGDAGRTLTGTVTVSLVRDDRKGGSYVLHRRFERER